MSVGPYPAKGSRTRPRVGEEARAMGARLTLRGMDQEALQRVAAELGLEDSS